MYQCKYCIIVSVFNTHRSDDMHFTLRSLFIKSYIVCLLIRTDKFYTLQVACTNWKRMLVMMKPNSRFHDPLDIPADSVHRNTTFSFLSDYKVSQMDFLHRWCDIANMNMKR